MHALLIVLYLVAILAIGWRAGRGESAEDFLIGGRSMRALPIAASIVALIGGGYLGALAAISFVYGIGVLWYTLGNMFGFVLLMLLAPRIREEADKHSFLTMADYFHDRFNRMTGGLVAIIVYGAFVSLLATQFIVGGAVFSGLFDIRSESAVLAMGVYTALYLLLGGFRAVVRTDMLQLAIMVAVFLVAVPLSMDAEGLIRTLRTGAAMVEPLPPLLIASFVVTGTTGIIAAADTWTRIYAAGSASIARRAVSMAAIVWLMFGLSLFVLGLMARVESPDGAAEDAFLTGLSSAFPGMLGGLAATAILAALMSSVDTQLFLLSTSAAKDFGSRLIGGRWDAERMTRWVRWAIVFNTVAAMLVAIYGPGLIAVGWIFSAMIASLAPSVFISLLRRIASGPVLASVAGGCLATLPFALTGVLTPDIGPLITATGATITLAGALAIRKLAR